MWISVTEHCDKIDKPSTKLNMDRIVRITPMQNMGCLLTTDQGRDIMVKELLPHFNVLDNHSAYVAEPPVLTPKIGQRAEVRLSEPAMTDEALDKKISDIIKNSLKFPTTQLSIRLKALAKEVIEENMNAGVVNNPPTKIIANTTRNIMG